MQLHPELPLFSSISFILVLLVALCYRIYTVPTLALFFWTLLCCIVNGVNVLAWGDYMKPSAPVWCDVSAKAAIGGAYGVTFSAFGIARYLAILSINRNYSVGKEQKRLGRIINILVSFVLPVFFMICHFIIQDHRYNIIENYGCQPAIYFSVPAIVFVWVPLLLSLAVSLGYLSLAVSSFIRGRLTFGVHLQTLTPNLTTSYYVRLLAMASIQTIWLTYVVSYSLASALQHGLRPWTGLAEVHRDFTKASTYNVEDLSSGIFRSVELMWWTPVLSSFLIFAFLGLGEHAWKEYRRVWASFSCLIWRRPEPKGIKANTDVRARSKIKPLHLVTLKSQVSYSSTTEASPAHQPRSPKFQSSDNLAVGKVDILEPQYALEMNHIKDGKVSNSYDPGLPSYDIDIPIIRRPVSPPPPFSVYQCYPTSPIEPTPIEPSLSMFAPEPPEPEVLVSLPPPPRRRPHHAGSKGSVKSTMTVVHGIPEDIGITSSQLLRSLNPSGSGILVTVERERRDENV